jgi:hypothetical protein
MITSTHDRAKEVRRRAADIRDHWSSLERLRRTGLPPDTPPTLRDFILGRRPMWESGRR